MVKQIDIVIIGGGLTGLTLARACKGLPMKIALIDNKPLQKMQASSAMIDIRAMAISHISQQIFLALDLWKQLKDKAFAIENIHISDQGHFGFSKIQAQDYKVSALGYVIAFDVLFNTLAQNILLQKNLEIFTPRSIQAIHDDLVELDNGDTIQAQMIIACDGGASSIRKLANIKAHSHDYKQTAIVCNIALKKPHAGIAYERFTCTGPLALLPLSPMHYSCVWCVAPEKSKQLLQQADNTFLAELQTQFGYRLGRFIAVSKRQSFPLQLIKATKNVKDRIILLGNASHTLHPVAGQGFNLCLRDVAVLAQLLANAKQSADFTALPAAFAQLRQRDQKTIIRITDALVKIFSNQILPLVLLRNLGLIGLDILPLGKKLLAKRNMGFIDNMPDLALGLSL